jgi:hypothetical protein
MVVLHEDDFVARGSVEGLLVEAFPEESARVAEHLGFENEHALDGGGDHVQGRQSVECRKRVPHDRLGSAIIGG